MKEKYVLYINGVKPRKNSKELTSSMIERYCEKIVKHVEVGGTLFFRPLGYAKEDNKSIRKPKSYQDKEMVFEKKIVDLADDVNHQVTPIIHVYLTCKDYK